VSGSRSAISNPPAVGQSAPGELRAVKKPDGARGWPAIALGK
jgi:hypothetical protein